MRMLVPRSIVWIQVLTALWTCAVLQNLCYFWCEWRSQSFLKCFGSQSKDLHKKPYAGIPAGMHLCVQGQQLYCPLIFLVFSAQLCTWAVLVGVNGFSWSCRCFRAVSSYAQGSTTGLETFFCSGSCAVTCHHSWCCFYTAFAWGWADISRRWPLRTDFPWPCDSFNLGCVICSGACPRLRPRGVSECLSGGLRAECDPSSLKTVACFALCSQYPRPVSVTIFCITPKDKLKGFGQLHLLMQSETVDRLRIYTEVVMLQGYGALQGKDPGKACHRNGAASAPLHVLFSELH